MKSTTLIPFYLKFILLFSLVSAIVNNSLMRLSNLRSLEKPVSENYIILKYKSLVTLNGQFLNVSEENIDHINIGEVNYQTYGNYEVQANTAVEIYFKQALSNLAHFFYIQ